MITIYPLDGDTIHFRTAKALSWATRDDVTAALTRCQANGETILAGHVVDESDCIELLAAFDPRPCPHVDEYHLHPPACRADPDLCRGLLAEDAAEDADQ